MVHGSTYNILLRRYSIATTARYLQITSKSWFQSAPSPRCYHATTLAATSSQDVEIGAFDVSLDPEQCTFPELYNPAATSATLIAIDPDVNGALAVLRWKPASRIKNSSTSSPLWASVGDIEASTDLTVIDMPTELWKLGTREKRHPDPAALAALFEEYTSSVTTTRDSGENSVLAAALEYTTPQHLSGKYAWYGIGFSTGALSALLVSQKIPYQRVNASAWKRQLGLYKLGKPGSMALAKQLFPMAAEKYLKRKKDHGRAEALLIAAWALGVRATAAPSTDIVSTVDSDDYDEDSDEILSSEGSDRDDEK